MTAVRTPFSRAFRRSVIVGWLLWSLVGIAVLAALGILSGARVFVVSYVGLLVAVAMTVPRNGTSYDDRAVVAVVLAGFVVYVGLVVLRFLELAAG